MPGEPTSKKVLMGHQEGDALSRTKGSAQEELAKFQLLKEKLLIRNDPTVDVAVREVLGAMSEVEVLTLDIATKLSTSPKYSQSSADYQELVRYTGESSYIGIAEKLAGEIYEIKRGQYLFSQFDSKAGIDTLRSTRLENVTGEGIFGFIARAVTGSASSGRS